MNLVDLSVPYYQLVLSVLLVLLLLMLHLEHPVVLGLYLLGLVVLLDLLVQGHCQLVLLVLLLLKYYLADLLVLQYLVFQ